MSPSAAPRASISPEMISIFSPHSMRTRFRKASALLASRTAAVATVRSDATCIARASAANRTSAATVVSIEPFESFPFCARPRPSPAITFSLNSAAGTRVSPW
jgi:hypothetical protein